MTKNLHIKIETIKFNLLAPPKVRQLFRQKTVTMDEFMLLFQTLENLNYTYLTFVLLQKYETIVSHLINDADKLPPVSEDMIKSFDLKMKNLICIISD